jgi:hypothetical protein
MLGLILQTFGAGAVFAQSAQDQQLLAEYRLTDDKVNAGAQATRDVQAGMAASLGQPRALPRNLSRRKR